MDNTIHHNVIYAGIQPFREFSYESSAELVHICQSLLSHVKGLTFFGDSVVRSVHYVPVCNIR